MKIITANEMMSSIAQILLDDQKSTTFENFHKRNMILELEVTLTCSESTDKQTPELCFVSVHLSC